MAVEAIYWNKEKCPVDFAAMTVREFRNSRATIFDLSQAD
jgi:hypothetical protein